MFILILALPFSFFILIRMNWFRRLVDKLQRYMEAE